MDYLKELGALALASRMKRLVGVLGNDVRDIYRAEDIEFGALLMPIAHLLNAKGQLQINQIVDYLGISQPAVTQLCKRLKREGLVHIESVQCDQRKRSVRLTAKGAGVVQMLLPVWHEIDVAVNDMMSNEQTNLIGVLDRFESQYEKQSLQQRVLDRLGRSRRPEVAIVSYRDTYKGHFKKLNLAWIERHFVVEASDRRVLSNPRQEIIDKGGFVYFAKVGRSVVGTYAMIRVDARTYEMAKMAVSEPFQKQGIGTRLLDHAIERAKALKLRRLVIYSNTRLAGAINLYFKKGFRVIPLEDYHNERANIKMELILSSAQSR
ncbi:MAG: bifunctional helix-turn-helix transcriptional regulator/GNAT family N-acetyltransferase [Planctomycetota bacterium]|jgi:GNAT superfamily N-acetyltransferase/DNA-binding HxlR family transcriptional regulator